METEKLVSEVKTVPQNFKKKMFPVEFSHSEIEGQMLDHFVSNTKKMWKVQGPHGGSRMGLVNSSCRVRFKNLCGLQSSLNRET